MLGFLSHTDNTHCQPSLAEARRQNLAAVILAPARRSDDILVGIRLKAIAERSRLKTHAVAVVCF
jgi:hypothetical protein